MAYVTCAYAAPSQRPPSSRPHHMALFKRRAPTQDSAGSSGDQDSNSERKEKGEWRRPANTAFKQQRLKAWQPILTPKTVLPTLFIIGIIFAPIGGLLLWGSGLVSEMTFDYTECENTPPSQSLSSLTFSSIPKYSYRLSTAQSKLAPSPPQYAFFSNSSNPDVSQQRQCIIQFEIVADLHQSVLIYYKLTNFFQNHRRYVKSLDPKQLRGAAVSARDLNNGGCKPLATTSDGKIIYPCGLIANSVFNDTFSNLTLVGATTSYNFSQSGIAWPGEAQKYSATTSYNLSDIVPPPNWALRYPDNYTSANFPNLQTDEHFQNWMRTAGLPTFSKLYGRNDHDQLVKGTYQLVIGLNFPVQPYKGTKSVVISTVSWIGGKNSFLGWSYIASAGLFALLALAGTIRHILKPRRLGDTSLLSWNQ